MAISDWTARWEALRRACENRKATGRWDAGRDKPPRFEVGPPATEQDVAKVEVTLGCAIPSSLRKVLLECSGVTSIEWQLRDKTALPNVFRQIFSGECRWDLASLPTLMAAYRQWLQVPFVPDTSMESPRWNCRLRSKSPVGRAAGCHGPK
jgi:cell wall assembly regulator SMI1